VLEDLPSNPPVFEYNAPNGPPKDSDVPASPQSIDFDPFATPSPFVVESKKVTPKAYDPNSHVACYTQFETFENPSRVLARLSLFFQDIKAQFDVDEATFMVKATIIAALGNVVLSVQIFSDPANEAKSIVQFRRRKGDSMQYRSIYFAIRGRLSDLVVNPVKNVSDAAAVVQEDALAERVGASVTVVQEDALAERVGASVTVS